MTSPATWSDVDRFFQGVVQADDALDAAQRDADAAGLPSISVSPAHGKLLHLLARIHGARRILEIGTLAGYSTIWMARALPDDGRLITLEFEPRHAAIAKANLERAGVANRVEIRVGPAIESLRTMQADRAEPFDLTFIDADKVSTGDYFEAALSLSRPGSLIVVDNVVRNGGVADPASTDPSVKAMRAFTEQLSLESRVSATGVQTVGVKGYDGFVLALVLR